MLLGQKRPVKEPCCYRLTRPPWSRASPGPRRFVAEKKTEGSGSAPSSAPGSTPPVRTVDPAARPRSAAAELSAERRYRNWLTDPCSPFIYWITASSEPHHLWTTHLHGCQLTNSYFYEKVCRIWTKLSELWRFCIPVAVLYQRN